MAGVSLVIEVDPDRLSGYEDSHLAALWHTAQVNSASFGDRAAGELVERIGREIIRRWLGTVVPELWHHQGRHHYWDQLRRLGTWREDGTFVVGPAADPPPAPGGDR